MMGRTSSRWTRGCDGCVTNFVWEKIFEENCKLNKSKPDGAIMTEEKQIALILNMLRLTYKQEMMADSSKCLHLDRGNKLPKE
jgi:hypothetical protein